jgi:hypothetical protein
MRDSLFDRADLAIQNSARHRQERRVLMTQLGDARDDLRRSVFENKMTRVEVAARREDQQFLNVNRRWIGTPDRRPKGTPLIGES